LAGLHKRLWPEPCQTGVFVGAPVEKPAPELVAASAWEAGSKRLRPPSPHITPVSHHDGAPHHRKEARAAQPSGEEAVGGEVP